MVLRRKARLPVHRWWRSLLEYAPAAGVPGTSPLRVDEDAGIIYRVKVLGRFSRNNHGHDQAEATEYSPACMKDALALYEGVKVKANHPADRARPAAERDVNDTFGVLKNCVLESDESGQPAVWADLHYLTTHPLAPRVVEDVKKGLGVYGLSHNATAARERFDRGARRLVIESLDTVRSVDLVDKPATNRNLWESEMPMTTLRQTLESWLPKQSTGRQKLGRSLLEMDDMPGMDAEMEAPAEGDSHEDALWTGFAAAIQSIAEQYKSGDLDAKSAGKKVMQYLKAHEGLCGDAEPAGDELEEMDEAEDEEDKKGDAMESEELKQLRTEKKVRELCESLDFAPTGLQIDALVGLVDDAKRRKLIESFKTQPLAYKTPKTGVVHKTPAKKNGTGRDVQESYDVKETIATLRNG